jgi:hypothetical protein
VPFGLLQEGLVDRSVRGKDGAAIGKVYVDGVVCWDFVGTWAVNKNVVACGTGVGYGGMMRGLGTVGSN